MGASIYANVSSWGVGPDMTLHLGGEYRCIAEALATGRGYSDPFGVPTGPTAWMPPVFPLLMAALLKLLGDFEAVAVVVVTLQNLVLIYAGLLVLRAVSGPEHLAYSRLIAFTLFVVANACHYYYVFRFTHDHVVVQLWVCLLYDLTDRLFRRVPGTLASAGWGVVGGLSVLTAPVLGPVWVGLSVMLVASEKRIRQFAISVLIATGVIAPWIARNALVLHRFIPVKSNLSFELYQSQCLERDGVLRQVTAFTHPYLCDGPERALYKQVGEMKYLDEKRDTFLESVRQDPLSYLKRAANRLLAATVLFIPYDSSIGPVSDFLGQLIHPLPIIGILLMLAGSRWTKDRRKVIALVIFCLYITPYIWVSYYIRYMVPLLFIKVLFCFWGLESARRMNWRFG